ncbi:MAG: Nitrogen regulatory protein [Verrucomicrobia bacterium ADurb.Bin345]|nr:MAG: Nitrogen regulatory protein [Verrucomicrobia bacterium ADurb.Bin345]
MKLSVKDAAELMGVTPKTIYRWIQESDLPAYRIEGQYRLNKMLLLEWARAKRINVAAPILEETPGGPVTKLSDALRNGGIFYRIGGHDRESVLRAVVEMLRLPESVDREFVYQALLARERLQSTGLGGGVAVPHVRNPLVLDVETPGVTLCFLDKPVDFAALDGQPVQVLFTLVSPSVRAHLYLLSRLSFCLQDPKFKAALQRQAIREDIMDEIVRIETSFPGADPSQASRP